jgi:hypothetical protein
MVNLRVWLKHTAERIAAWWRADLRVIEINGDQLPTNIRRHCVVHVVDHGSEWSAGLICPCGCGDTIELLLLPSVTPHWTLTLDQLSRPTLMPSIWRTTGCRSHFWVRSGRVVWVKPN